jgi:chromosome partitioning protein
MSTVLPPASGNYSLADIRAIADRALGFVDYVRKQLFAPDATKQAPKFNLSQLAVACGVDKNVINRRLAKGGDDLPTGIAINATRREFTLAEVRQWVRAYNRFYQRTAEQNGAVIAVGNFKGGVSKTTTAVNLALGLSLKGYKVLLVDFDSQGSLTNLMGVSPEMDVEPEDTFLRLAYMEDDDDESLRPAIRKTYWDGVDLVPASVALNNADFLLPLRQSRDSNFRFWDVLGHSLRKDGILAEYDYVIIDTPPSLSYLTLNAFYAADGLLVPLPPEGPDFASSIQFWSLFSELGNVIDSKLPEAERKRYSWVRVMPAKVDHTKPTTAAMLEWMRAAYGSELLPLEIPTTSAVSYAGTQFGSLYDISRYVGSAKTYARARDAYDQLVDKIDNLTRVYKWQTKA